MCLLLNYVSQIQSYWREVVNASVSSTLVTGEHSLHVLEIIEAARKSGKTGERIQIESEFKWPVVS